MIKTHFEKTVIGKIRGFTYNMYGYKLTKLKLYFVSDIDLILLVSSFSHGFLMDAL